MATIKEYLDYAELAQASYSDLVVGIPSIQKLKEEYKAEFTQQQATDFANRYTVLAVSNNPNGFSATLFTDTSGNKYLSIRGSDYTLEQSFSRSRILFGGEFKSKNTRSAA